MFKKINIKKNIKSDLKLKSLHLVLNKVIVVKVTKFHNSKFENVLISLTTL